jgi:hypothetical protein
MSPGGEDECVQGMTCTAQCGSPFLPRIDLLRSRLRCGAAKVRKDTAVFHPYCSWLRHWQLPSTCEVGTFKTELMPVKSPREFGGARDMSHWHLALGKVRRAVAAVEQLEA